MAKPLEPTRVLRAPAAQKPALGATVASKVAEKSARQLGLAALTLSGAWALVTTTTTSLGAVFGPESSTWFNPYYPIAGVGIGVSAIAGFLLRRPELPPRVRTWIGIAFVVFVAFILTVSEARGAWWVGARRTGIPWACLFVALYPLLVPGRLPRTVATLAAIVLAMLAAPWAAWTAFSLPLPTVEAHADIAVPAVIAAALSLIPAQVMAQLSAKTAAIEELGSYNLKRLLGRGGMGEVWMAEHRMLARPSAIKLIKPESLAGARPEAQADALARFSREARATAALRSPHTVELYDFGVSDDGQLYYAMELLDGLDLHTLVANKGALAPNRTIYILKQICESLTEAHQRGLVHRDIKPGNIMLCRVGPRYDFIKVLDFGLVKTTASGPGDANLTAQGVMVGTPAFVAPEQAAGREVTAQSDLYAVGCVAYWLLTRHFVFESDSTAEMNAAHINLPPVRPSSRGALVPQKLEDLVMQCLAKKPDDRPQGVADLARRLDDCAEGPRWNQSAASSWWAENGPKI